MAPKRKKSPARSWQQKSSDYNARSAAGSKEETMESDLHACALPSTSHSVHFEQYEHSRNSAAQCGDNPRVSLRILLSAIKNMGEKLEDKIDVLTPRLLKTIWSTGLNKGDFNVMANLQHQLEAAKDDNSKVTTMLEHVLASHSKMQAALDAVQTELGHKDTEINSLRKDRSQSQQKIQMLETELEHYKAKLVAMERQHSSQLEPLSKALEVARTDKKTLSLRLEEALQANNILQSKLIQTQCDLKSKETEHQQLMACREQLMERVKTEEKMHGEHLETLKKQFHAEQEISRKAARRESTELKKALEGSSSRLAEVSRANRELRQKVIELEKTLSSYREKLKSQRAQVRQCLVSKANTERIKEIESELREMEAIKEQYQKKNYEQSQNIQKFVSELKSLRSEMQILLENQHKVQVQNRQLETQLEVERRRGQQLENQRQILEKTVQHMKKCKEETEKKLKEASIESEQITNNLEEAHRWFKSKFDSLQLELVKNHQPVTLENSSKKMEKKQPELPICSSPESRVRTQHLQLTSRKAYVSWAGNELT